MIGANPRRAGAIWALVLPGLSLAIPSAAVAGESKPFAEMYPVIGTRAATVTSGWAHIHPSEDLGRFCDAELRLDLRASVRVRRVEATRMHIETLTLEWKDVTPGGHFAGYGLYTSDDNYMGGPFWKIGDPTVTPGRGKRTVRIDKTVEYRKTPRVYWMQNFSFDGETFGAAVGGPQGTFPTSCLSYSMLFHIVPIKPGAGSTCTDLPVSWTTATRPADKC